MKYHEPLPMSRPELEASIESGNQTAITEALLSAAFYDADWRWVQGICLRFLDHADPIVRWLLHVVLVTSPVSMKSWTLTWFYPSYFP